MAIRFEKWPIFQQFSFVVACDWNEVMRVIVSFSSVRSRTVHCAQQRTVRYISCT